MPVAFQRFCPNRVPALFGPAFRTCFGIGFRACFAICFGLAFGFAFSGLLQDLLRDLLSDLFQASFPDLLPVCFRSGMQVLFCLIVECEVSPRSGRRFVCAIFAAAAPGGGRVIVCCRFSLICVGADDLMFWPCLKIAFNTIFPKRDATRPGGVSRRAGFCRGRDAAARFPRSLLNDSKQMTERSREKLVIIEREAVAWAVEAVSAERIDEINILNASFEECRWPRRGSIPLPAFWPSTATASDPARTAYRCIVKGDGSKYADIAAASVLASKTHRDSICCVWPRSFPVRLAEEQRLSDARTPPCDPRIRSLPITG